VVLVKNGNKRKIIHIDIDKTEEEKRKDQEEETKTEDICKDKDVRKYWGETKSAKLKKSLCQAEK